MAVWELSAVSSEFAQYLATNSQDNDNEVFDTNGVPKVWSIRPKLEVFKEKRRKTPKPLGDASFVTAGSIILNQKAYDALHAFLGQFGEFLEVEYGGEVVYFYNVTNIISCIDPAKSRYVGPSLFKAAFHVDLEPKDAQVFKDPLMLEIAIYVSDPAKAILEQLVADAKLTGMQFEAPFDGQLVPFVRPRAT